MISYNDIDIILKFAEKFISLPKDLHKVSSSEKKDIIKKFLIECIKKFNCAEEISKKSFEIISSKFVSYDVPKLYMPILKRIVHATADFSFLDTILFHRDVYFKTLRAIEDSKEILTDIEMVKTGINKKLASKFDIKIKCFINDPLVVEEAKIKGCSKAAVGIAKGINENTGIIVIGNAPTALIKTIEILKNYPISKIPVVIGMPVGFVNALESKLLLSLQDKIPFITNIDRRGGTPVAVAIINAFLEIHSKI